MNNCTCAETLIAETEAKVKAQLKVAELTAQLSMLKTNLDQMEQELCAAHSDAARVRDELIIERDVALRRAALAEHQREQIAAALKDARYILRHPADGEPR